MFRMLIVFGNLIALGFVIYAAGDNMPNEAGEIFTVFSVMFLLTSNIFLLMCCGERGTTSQWPFIIVKRKTLEERKRIKELESATDNNKEQ